jgi:hypothetical protein
MTTDDFRSQRSDQAVRSPKNYLSGLRTKIALLDEPGAPRSSMTKSFGYFLSRSLSFLLP